MHYLTYDPDTLWRRMTDAWIQSGGEVLYPGDEKEMILRGVQEVIFLAFAGMDNALRMNTLRYAVGEYLDAYGEKRGCARMEASPAMARVLIRLQASDGPGTIPAGSLLTADGLMTWRMIEDLSYTGMAMDVTVWIECTRTGAEGNALVSGTVMRFVDDPGNVFDVTVTDSATGGQAREDDESYRERIRMWAMTAVTTGPRMQYIAAAKGASTDVLDANAARTGDGEVTVYILTSSAATQAAAIAEVEAALSSDSVRPLTDSVTVTGATEMNYVLGVNCRGETGASIASAVAEAVAAYQEWQDKKIGRAFNPEKLTAMLYQAGCSYVAFDASSHFDGGPAVYTAIEPSEYCRGVITVSVGS